jgi:hypothetical protein
VVGTSADMFWINDPVDPGWCWFGGDRVANMRLEVEVIPEAANLCLLGLGALALLRRR